MNDFPINMGLQKPFTYRNRAYMDWIKKQPCICGCGSRDNDPHHVGRAGTSMKTDDYRCLPLCRKVHRKINAVGWGPNRVAKEYGLDYQELIIKHLMRYIDSTIKNKQAYNGSDEKK